MKEQIILEVQPSGSGQQSHQIGASANRYGQAKIVLGNPSYSDIHLSADSTHSYANATISSPNVLNAVALLQANAYSFIKYAESYKTTQINFQIYG